MLFKIAASYEGGVQKGGVNGWVHEGKGEKTKDRLINHILGLVHTRIHEGDAYRMN